jgi:chromosome segregation ATPase
MRQKNTVKKEQEPIKHPSEIELNIVSAKLEAAKKDLSQVTKQTEDASTKYAGLLVEIDKLEAEKNTLLGSYSKLKADVDSFEATIESKKQEIESFGSKKKEAEEVLSVFLRDISLQKNKFLEKIENEKAVALAEKNSVLREIENKKADLEVTIKTDFNLAEQIESKTKQITTSTEIISGLEKSLEDLKSKITKQEELLDISTKRADEANKDNIIASNKTEELTKEILKLEGEVEKLDKEIEEKKFGILSIIARERKVADLTERIKAHYAKAGIELKDL